MTEFDKADLDSSGAIERNEWALLELDDRRKRIDDEDLKRNAERRYTGFALAGMLLYPLIILLASWLELDKAATLVTDIASVYVIAASGVVASYLGFNAYAGKAKQTSISYDKGEGK